MVYDLSSNKGCPLVLIGYCLPDHERDIDLKGLERIASVSSRIKRGVRAVKKTQKDFLIRTRYGLYAGTLSHLGTLDHPSLEVLFHGNPSQYQWPQGNTDAVKSAVDTFIEVSGVPDYYSYESKKGNEILNEVLERYGKKIDIMGNFKNDIVDIKPATNIKK